MSGISSDLKRQLSMCNLFTSLRWKTTFTPDELFVVEAITGGGGLHGNSETRKKIKTLHFKPTLLTASCPQYDAKQDLRCWAQRNKYSNKYSTDSPHWLSLIHTHWSHQTLTTNTQTDKTSHTTLSWRFLRPP